MVKRISMLVVSSLAMMACGPGLKIDGKQGAAEAMFAASQPTKGNTSASPADLTANCPEGGTAAITGAGISIGGSGVGTSFNMKYSGGTLPHDAMMRSIELFGTQAAPRVRELLS